MSDLERRYRRWLRLYPKDYRSVRGEEILGTLLDSASGRRWPAGDVIHIVGHAIRVRIALLAKDPRRPRVPQPARLVMWLLLAFAVFDWYLALSQHGGPQNPGHNTLGIVAGCINVGLVLLLGARRRRLYGLVIAILAAFVAGGFAATGSMVGGVIAGAPNLFLLVLLMAGRHRYMRTVSEPGRA